MDSFKAALASSAHVVAVAGAGLSAASGLPTFRGGQGGMWRKYDALSLATPDAFAEDPSLVWQFFSHRRAAAAAAAPNAAHAALARLPAALAPASFTLVTQNTDGLSQRALDGLSQRALDALPPALAPPPGPPPLLEMLGRLADTTCTVCAHTARAPPGPLTPALAATDALVADTVLDPDIPPAALPRCARCGALARPAVVWFGEEPRHLPAIAALVAQADLCLVVGSSSTVYPAAHFAREVRRHGGKVAVFNTERSHGDADADFLFLGPCEVLLPQALGFA